MTAWCAECGEEFDPVEYRPASFDGPNFCSDDCETAYCDTEEFTAIYWSAGDSAPVF